MKTLSFESFKSSFFQLVIKERIDLAYCKTDDLVILSKTKNYYDFYNYFFELDVNSIVFENFNNTLRIFEFLSTHYYIISQLFGYKKTLNIYEAMPYKISILLLALYSYEDYKKQISIKEKFVFFNDFLKKQEKFNTLEFNTIVKLFFDDIQF